MRFVTKVFLVSSVAFVVTRIVQRVKAERAASAPPSRPVDLSSLAGTNVVPDRLEQLPRRAGE